jgi:hypothetical protein
VIGGMRQIHDEELHTLYYSPNSIRRSNKEGRDDGCSIQHALGH